MESSSGSDLGDAPREENSRARAPEEPLAASAAVGGEDFEDGGVNAMLQALGGAEAGRIDQIIKLAAEARAGDFSHRVTGTSQSVCIDQAGCLIVCN